MYQVRVSSFSKKLVASSSVNKKIVPGKTNSNYWDGTAIGSGKTNLSCERIL